MSLTAPPSARQDDGIERSDPAVTAFMQQPDTCLSAMIETALDGYPGRTALAWRPARGGILSASFEQISYEDLGHRSRAVASALVHDPALAMKPGDAIGIMAFANVDFVTLNLALGLGGFVIAPLQTSASMEALTGLVEELKAPCLAASLEHLDAIVSLAIASDNTRCVLIFDFDGLDSSAEAALLDAQARLEQEKPGCTLLPFSEVIRRGESYPAVKPFVPDAGTDPLALIYYTSGSTGTPKGVLYSQKLVKSAYANSREISPIVLHYQPLNHSFGMSYIAMALASGGTTFFTAKSDLSTLLDDMKLVRPTAMALVPRISELLYQRFHADYASLIAQDEKAAVERFREEVLGGRLADIVTGAAPTAPELRQFIEKVTGQTLLEGYGCTEAGGSITFMNRVMRPPVTDYRLIDVPDLGYFTTDKPHPRGELILKSRTMFSGYLGRPDLTDKAFDAEGYYHTGDIMEEVEPDHLVYLDRTNNVMKLSQGEFVPVAMLESLYAGGDPSIRQVYLYGNSSRAFLLGVIVPNMDALPAGMEEGEVRACLLAAMERVAVANGRHSYEVPRDILIEHEPFSAENGLLAGIGKYMRPAFRERYGETLESLYEQIAAGQERDLKLLRQTGRDGPVLETVCKAVAAVLGGKTIPVDADGSFASSGGDSLSALSLSMLLEEIYDISVDVSLILQPSGTYGSLAQEIEARISGEAGLPDAISIHGKDLSTLRAEDLTLDRFLDAGLLEKARDLPPPPDAEPEIVFLTGATGFLGRFLCLEWLRRMERTGKGRLICVARGSDEADARARIMAGFEGGDGALAREVARLARDRLTVLSGDIALPHLGLSPDCREALAEQVDLIVHPAALVNHKLPYRQLFGPNAAGVAELIGLALTGRKKRIVHVSTIATTFNAGRRADERTDIRQVIPQWNSSEAYADGYGSSKWAAEVLLTNASEQFGVPVSIFRSNMILAPEEFSGQLNVPDVFTRMIFSLAVTGLAPESFYSGDSKRAHYEGLPVDFLARAIVGIGENNRSGLHIFHALNPHDDGVSQDTFANWISDAGIGIERVRDYGDWAIRISTAMRALPEAQRQASVLPLMDAYQQPSPAVPDFQDFAPHFVDAVKQAEITPDGKIPHLTSDLIARYIEDLRAFGLLHPDAKG
ncbi:MAG: carboxylic acid reductase [Sphingomonadaceae bacterium]